MSSDGIAGFSTAYRLLLTAHCLLLTAYHASDSRFTDY
jgi:hypothetical protein